MFTKEKSITGSHQPQRLRLDFLDGLRGLAAFYVVLFHAFETSGNGPYGGMHTNLPDQLVAFLGWLSCGHLAVVVFIALSGYCLMMPVAMSNSLPGGFTGYIRRRARRLLPPYFAAFAVSLILIAIVPGLNRKQGVYWDGALPAFTWESVLSHVFLVHNFTPWSSRINYPLWTVATEWQIYFLLPLVLLPMLWRFSLSAMLCVAVFIGVAPHYFFHGRFDGACPQFVGVFAIGAAGALINFSPKYSHILKKYPWRVISIVSCGILLLSTCLKPSLVLSRPHLSDLVIGAMTTTLLIYCTSLVTGDAEHRGSLALNILQARPLVWLGTFSYSLYLMHAPILAMCHLVIRNMSVSPIPVLLLLLSFGSAFSLLGAYLFHRVFERPFLAKPRAQVTF